MKNLPDLNRYLGLVDWRKPAWHGKKQLNQKQRQIMLMHLSGFDRPAICEQLQVSPSYVSSTVNSDAGRRVEDDFMRFSDREFKALYILSIKAIRDALNSDDIRVRLNAADKYFRAHGKYGDSGLGEGATAEDVIKRIMEFSVKMTETRPANSAKPVGPKLIKGGKNAE